MTIQINGANLSDMTLGDVAALPTSVIHAAFEGAEAEIKSLTHLKKMLVAAVERKFADDINAMGTGSLTSLTIEREGTLIKVTRPKSVVWDQEILHDLYVKIENEWGDDPAEYIQAKYGVREDAYNGWPTTLRKQFEPARTVKAGATSLKFALVPQEEN